MVRAEGKVRLDGHGRIGGRDVGDNQVNDTLECLALPELGVRWDSMCQFRVPEA